MHNLAEHNPAIRAELLRWYRRNGRALPWRDETDPYRIWVSEVMLQQTQVATVVPYYHRFLARFPTVEALAAASQEQVLKLWEGLGYYARARNLHRAAREIVEKWSGRLPQSGAQLRTLPGFGEYTAAAVASIAFGEPVAAVDGNVKRVLARLFAVETDVTRNPGARHIGQAAQQLLESRHPGDWNQAVMELGATVCTPTSPRCAGCPLRKWCRARQLGLQSELPRRPPRRKVPHYQVTAAV
ncbi:MAG: A/G-specific adenine glycosylase, partial [Chloroflexi bacterium]